MRASTIERLRQGQGRWVFAAAIGALAVTGLDALDGALGHPGWPLQVAAGVLVLSGAALVFGADAQVPSPRRLLMVLLPVLLLAWLQGAEFAASKSIVRPNVFYAVHEGPVASVWAWLLASLVLLLLWVPVHRPGVRPDVPFASFAGLFALCAVVANGTLSLIDRYGAQQMGVPPMGHDDAIAWAWLALVLGVLVQAATAPGRHRAWRLAAGVLVVVPLLGALWTLIGARDPVSAMGAMLPYLVLFLAALRTLVAGRGETDEVSQASPVSPEDALGDRPESAR